MSNASPIYCIVDDTPLTTNLDEIGSWVQSGTVALVVPLYTLERLHLLKKDASQIGQNSRKAVKFLDQASSTADLPHDPIIIQGPDDQYMTWSDVERRYLESIIQRDDPEPVAEGDKEDSVQAPMQFATNEDASPGKLLNSLSLSSEDIKTSPVSTPPLSPSASDPQSAKTSPEVRCVPVTKHDATPIPPTLKSLINFVVWYNYESKGTKEQNVTFLTNSADAAQIAKDFGVVPKTIHQLRASIPSEQSRTPKTDMSKQKKRSSNRRSSFKSDSEPRTLFRYDEGSSEDEELVFQPRSRELPRPGSSGRGNANSTFRGRGTVHSPSNSISNPAVPKPQVPVEEIDPDSFDRGTFARGSTPLANIGNHYGSGINNFSRGGSRNFSGSGQRGGSRGNTHRGRGRGRLFVP